MVFIDHMNFNISFQSYYHHMGRAESPRIDYRRFLCNLVAEVPNVAFVKAYICIPRPDEFLMGDPKIASYYRWASSMRNIPFFEIIEGRMLGRPVSKDVEKNIEDPSTFYRVEKGSDVNFAINAISKAFFNSYDVGFFLSADTDYIMVYDMIRRMGKTVVQAAVDGQRSPTLARYVDLSITLTDEFFQRCLPEPEPPGDADARQDPAARPAPGEQRQRPFWMPGGSDVGDREM